MSLLYTEDDILHFCTEERVCQYSTRILRIYYNYSIHKGWQTLSLLRGETVFSTQSRECPLLYTEDDIYDILCIEKRALSLYEYYTRATRLLVLLH